MQKNSEFLSSPIACVACERTELLKTEITTVKLGNKERVDKEQIGIKELFMNYQPFYTINLLLDKELLPI